TRRTALLGSLWPFSHYGVIFFFFLALVPAPAAIIEHGGHENASNRPHHQKGGHGFGAHAELFEDEAHDNRHTNDEQTREYHLLQRSGGHNVNALPVGRLLGTLQDTGMLAELPTHFLDHVARGRPNGPYRHSREQKDQHRSQ